MSAFRRRLMRVQDGEKLIYELKSFEKLDNASAYRNSFDFSGVENGKTYRITGHIKFVIANTNLESGYARVQTANAYAFATVTIFLKTIPSTETKSVIESDIDSTFTATKDSNKGRIQIFAGLPYDLYISNLKITEV